MMVLEAIGGIRKALSHRTRFGASALAGEVNRTKQAAPGIAILGISQAQPTTTKVKPTTGTS